MKTIDTVQEPMFRRSGDNIRFSADVAMVSIETMHDVVDISRYFFFDNLPATRSAITFEFAE